MKLFPTRRRLQYTVLLALVVNVGATAAPAQETTPDSELTFTRQQAVEGKVGYEEHCAVCHGFALEGFELASSLSGKYFNRRWGGNSAAELAAKIRAMPLDNPNGLAPAVYTNIFAYILQANGFKAGDNPLVEQLDALAKITVPLREIAEPEGPRPPAAARYGSNGPLVRNSALNNLQNVTAKMLTQPPADDWLHWRRDYGAQGHSPLKQINRKNVKNLSLAWSWSLPPGPNMMTPIVHNGVLFAYSNGDVVEAFDAATGDLLWSYQHQISGDYVYNSKKGVALFEDKVIVPTSDLHMLALDMRTGKLIWDHAIDVGSETSHWMKSAPLIAGGKAIIGLTGQVEVEGGNFIVAIDLASGEEAWRFYTVARPGDVNGNSWNGLPLEKRTGGSVWIPGSYDPELNLAYFGAAPTYDTIDLRVKPEGKTNINSDALYTNATLAINPDTGKLVWYHQHQRNDQLDHDWTFERQIVTLPINGRERKVIITAGKQAIFEALDAATGEFLFFKDMDLQNVYAAIDPATGEKTLNIAAIPQPGQVLPGLSMPGICPNALGARNLQAAAYNPASKLLFIPLTDTCIDRATGKQWRKVPDPSSEGQFGLLRALNLATGEVLWNRREVAPAASAALATGDDLLFIGTVDRWFKAIDQKTGEVLWQQRLNNAPSSYPVTFRVNGKQYIAVATNRGSFHVNGMTRLAGANNPPVGASLMVFALPED